MGGNLTSYDEVNSTLQKAAKRALMEWGRDDSPDDLTQDLWVWYLERPATQERFATDDEFLCRQLAYLAALQILAGQSLSSDTFNDKALYSSESVKDALKGRSTNRYLIDILPRAMAALAAKNEGQAEAIRSRYDDGVIPKGSDADMLTKAHKSLTEHVNIIAITAGVDAEGKTTTGPGSRSAVFPETRKAKGNHHSDPTGEMAMALLAAEGDVREAFFENDWVVDLTTEYEEHLAPLSIFDGTFNGMAGSEMYRAQVVPELFPGQKPMLLENWPLDDLEAYCGGEFTPGYYQRKSA